MRNVIHIALNDLRVFFADFGNIFGLVGLPLVLTVLIGSAFDATGGEVNVRLRIDLLDLDQSEQSQAFIQQLRQSNSTLFLCPADRDEFNCNLSDEQQATLDETGMLTVDESIERVRNQQTRALIVIPEGFSEAIQTFEPVTIDYYSGAEAMTDDAVLRSLEALVQRANAPIVAAQVGAHVGDSFEGGTIFSDDADRQQFTDAVYQRATMTIAQQPVEIQYVLTAQGEREPTAAETQGFGQSVPGMGSMFVMFTVLGGVGILIRERQQWTLQRLVTMPLTRAEILGGKILYYFTLGMLQFVIVFGVGMLLGVNLGNDLLALLLIMVAFVLCTTALALALATQLTTISQAGGITFLLAMTLAPLGGAWWPLEIAPEFMQLIGRISPIAWAMEGFRGLIFYNATLVDVLPEVAVLLAASVVLFGVGILGFRYE